MIRQHRPEQRGGNQQPGQAPKKEAEVHLIVNTRKNSVVAHAPPDKMAIIEKAVEALDVDADRFVADYARIIGIDPSA